MIEIDARGFSCPIPVLETKKAIERETGEEIQVIVNQETQVENIRRLAEGKGYTVTVAQSGDDYRLLLNPNA